MEGLHIYFYKIVDKEELNIYQTAHTSCIIAHVTDTGT